MIKVNGDILVALGVGGVLLAVFEVNSVVLLVFECLRRGTLQVVQRRPGSSRTSTCSSTASTVGRIPTRPKGLVGVFPTL